MWPEYKLSLALASQQHSRCLVAGDVRAGFLALPIDKSASNYSSIEDDPAYARQVNVLVALLQAEPKPQNRRQQIGTP
jgi:hypothetical protein